MDWDEIEELKMELKIKKRVNTMNPLNKKTKKRAKFMFFDVFFTLENIYRIYT